MDYRALKRAVLRNDLGAFVAQVLLTVSPGDEYRHNWHHDAIVFELLRVMNGENRRLVLTQPPRSLKSICTSVAFVAWCLGHDPSLRFICISYSQDLADTFARQFRAVVRSEWYREAFPRMRLAKDSVNEIETTLGGGRLAVSVGGSLTGRGADIIIIDDPMKADEAQSELARKTVVEWYAGTLFSRLDDKERGALIVVAQRLHEDDLPGVLLRTGAWHHLDLPAIAQEDQVVRIGPGAVHLFRKGEALHPERESLATLETIRREMGSFKFSAQYLQRPLPAEGNLVKRAWIKSYETLPSARPLRIIQSWDVASAIGETNDYSVCTTWQVVKRDYYLVDVWRGKLEFPYLKSCLASMAHKFSANTILIEETGPGLHLVQQFHTNPMPGVSMPIGVRPDGDKKVRLEAQSACFEAGQVHLPTEAEWLRDFLEELLGFPSGRHDDQVDSTSQFLNWIESRREPPVAIQGPVRVV
jgi:predicted phage terminase large subunit-like protein